MSTRPHPLGTPHHVCQADAISYLRRSVFDEAVASGKLKPCLRRGHAGSVFYRSADVQSISLDIAAGIPPSQK